MTVNPKTRDSVFTKLFSQPEYALQLYQVLHPEDKNVTEKDLKIFSLENVLVNDFYNDLGLLVKNRIILLVEAQSTWNPNMALRTFIYLSDTYKKYISETNIDIFACNKIEIPRPEIFVIYTGDRKELPEFQRLSDNFCKTPELKNILPVEITVKMIYNSKNRDIVFQYINFCKVYTQQMRTFKDDKIKAVSETFRICKNKKLLKDFLQKHQQEVSNIMTAWGFDVEWLRRVHEENTQRIIKEQEAEIKENAAIIKENEAIIKENAEKIKESAAIIKESAEKIKENEAIIKAQTAQLEASKTELEASKTELEASKTELEASKTELESKNTTIEEQSAQLEASKATIENQEAIIKQLQEKLALVKN